MPTSNDMGRDLSPVDFERIREAVMETPRGRWFLNEYASRLRSTETSAMLDSMKRLESSLSASHDALMSRLADALTREPAPGHVSAPQADLAPKHMKFFKQDEEIFEPAPQTTIATVKESPKPEVPKGAKLIIRRTTETQSSVEVTAEAASIPAPFEPPAQPVLEAPLAPAETELAATGGHAVQRRGAGAEAPHRHHPPQARRRDRRSPAKRNGTRGLKLVPQDSRIEFGVTVAA
jgi:hypothetical protein